MQIRGLRLCLSMFFLAQTVGAVEIIRIGDAALALTKQEVTNLLHVIGDAGAPLLLSGEISQTGKVHVTAFLPPTTESTALVRGEAIVLARDSATPGRWLINRKRMYAQLRQNGRGLRDVTGSDDPNQPFLVDDDFSDSELTALMTSVRGWQAKNTGKSPIVRVRRKSDNEVLVETRVALGSVHLLECHSSGAGWSVMYAGRIER